MAEVTEVRLPGVGVRHEFETEDGQRLGVLTHRGGRRELLVYSERDPDACQSSVNLGVDAARTLAELLGASSVSEEAAAMTRIEGLAIDWIEVPDDQGKAAGRSIAELAMRSATGASIIAVLRGGPPPVTIPAPEPSEVLAAGDTVVVAGTPDGIERARILLAGR